MNKSRKEKPSMNSSIANKIKEERIVRKKDLSDSTNISNIRLSSAPVVMSTPKRNSRTINSLEKSTSLNRSRSVLSRNESISQKSYHKNYDPNIELRKVNERVTKRQSNSWADQSLLNDEEDEDYQKYSDKLRKSNKIMKLEKDTDVLTRRQGDIDKGKVKSCYKNYVYSINKTEREPFMPKTPNKFMIMSRRAWDGMVRKWKKHIHAWNEPNFEELYRTGIDFDCCSESSMSVRESIDYSDDNIERQEQVFVSEDEEDTLQGLKSRKRVLSVKLEKENCDEDTVEGFPTIKTESKLSDLHSGLTQDAAALNVGPSKRMRLSDAGK